jgi:CheY-like chemotaxis protein
MKDQVAAQGVRALTGTRILLVEDEPHIQDPMSHALRRKDYTVDVAATVAEAKARLISQLRSSDSGLEAARWGWEANRRLGSRAWGQNHRCK